MATIGLLICRTPSRPSSPRKTSGERTEIARAAHRQFLRTYNLNADDVPLLWLDRWNWETPFKVID